MSKNGIEKSVILDTDILYKFVARSYTQRDIHAKFNISNFMLY
jgi:hypothetical protein